jgi:naphthalene 1,2-dioxygenase ferredoxin component
VSVSGVLTRRRVARFEELPEGEGLAVALGEREVALYRIGSNVYATDNLCTHGAARLCEGFLDGYWIECPFHQGAFDVRTGIATRAPAEEPLATYVVEIENGEVYIVVSADPPR